MDPVLVATDGGATATSALRFAAAYSEREGAPVEVITVVEPLADVPLPLPHRLELERAHARGVAERVRDHLLEVVGRVDWPIAVRLGRPAPAICQVARERSAQLVVLGVEPRSHQGNPTAVEVMQLAETPVLSVHRDRLPRVAVVGIDFRRSSVRAARAAHRLVGREGVLHLVHVRPALDFPAASVWDWKRCYARALDAALDRITVELAAAEGPVIRRHVTDGEPLSALMERAEALDADLLAVGADGYACRGRVVIGQVAQRLLREAKVSVLATPVPAGTELEIAPLSGVAASRD